MKRYKVSVKTPNRFLSIKSKIVRTPTDFIILENEIKSTETKFKSDGISDYSIDLLVPEKVNPKKVEDPKIVESKEEIKIENKPSNSTLSKILNSWIREGCE